MRAVRPLEESPRLNFVGRVAEAFEDAGVRYAILHNTATIEHGRDSDVDIAVGSECRETVDWIIRAGTFGRLLQRIDYDVPWCRYYVVESDEPGRRYRQLDVACDPWGIGRYGDSVRLALSSAELSHGVRVASPAAQTVYLAHKRARKRQLRPGDTEQLRNSFQRDRPAARDLLEQHLGNLGVALAQALEGDRLDLTTELRALRWRASIERLKPQLVWRHLAFGILRTGRRLLRPTGLVVAVVGPDGVGKSRLATGLENECVGAFRRSARLHFGPGLLPSPARLIGRATPGSSDPHRRLPSGRMQSLARVVYLWLDVRVGWWPKVSVPRIRSTLVVLERGWPDLIVDPVRYRVSHGAGLIRSLGWLLPRSDLTLFLDGDPEVVHERKPELDVTEIDRQLRHWRALNVRGADRIETLDATRPAEAVLETALGSINTRLASRQLDIASGELARACLGKPVQSGSHYWAIARRGRPRWFLRAHAKSAGLLRTGIYRPAQRRHLAGVEALDLILRASRGRLGTTSRITVDPGTGLAPAIASSLGRMRVEIAGVAVPKDRRQRAHLSVWDDSRRLVAFAKIAREGRPLQHEERVLRALTEIEPKTFVAPRVLASFEWQEATVLVLEPLLISGRTDRPLGERETEALGEIFELRDRLCHLLGWSGDGMPAHGDFAPWNSGVTDTGRLAVWDWEDACLGGLLDDYFHWHVQRLVLMSSGSLADLIKRAMDPDTALRTLCRTLSVAPEEAPNLLRSYLERSALRPHPSSLAAEVRFRAIERLEGLCT